MGGREGETDRVEENVNLLSFVLIILFFVSFPFSTIRNVPRLTAPTPCRHGSTCVTME
jgi:hypothetical protein